MDAQFTARRVKSMQSRHADGSRMDHGASVTAMCYPNSTRSHTPMARPIWTGTLSFGLLNVPVSLMSGERKVDLHFRMLDSRDKKPIRFERVNADTGDECRGRRSSRRSSTTKAAM